MLDSVERRRDLLFDEDLPGLVSFEGDLGVQFLEELDRRVVELVEVVRQRKQPLGPKLPTTKQLLSTVSRRAKSKKV